MQNRKCSTAMLLECRDSVWVRMLSPKSLKYQCNVKNSQTMKNSHKLNYQYPNYDSWDNEYTSDLNVEIISHPLLSGTLKCFESFPSVVRFSHRKVFELLNTTLCNHCNSWLFLHAFLHHQENFSTSLLSSEVCFPLQHITLQKS